MIESLFIMELFVIDSTSFLAETAYPYNLIYIHTFKDAIKASSCLEYKFTFEECIKLTMNDIQVCEKFNNNPETCLFIDYSSNILTDLSLYKFMYANYWFEVVKLKINMKY